MSDGEPVVGIVGDADDAIPAAIEDAGGAVEHGDVDSVLATDPDLIVTIGSSTTLSVARERPDASLVPVDAGRGLRSVPSDDAVTAVAHAVTESFETETHPVLCVERAGDSVAHAVTDVTLVTAEAARISEFSVTDQGDRVGQFRADGVVVATPAGTAGYTHRLGTPITSVEANVLSVAPIAPFATNPDDWILSREEIELTVERDEAVVLLFADDQRISEVQYDETVRLTDDGSVTVALLPESRPRFP